MRRGAFASDVLIVLVCAAAASSAQHDEDHGAEVRLCVSVRLRTLSTSANLVCGVYYLSTFMDE